MLFPRHSKRQSRRFLVSLRNRRGYGAASKLAGRPQSRLKRRKDAQKVAQELAEKQT